MSSYTVHKLLFLSLLEGLALPEKATWLFVLWDSGSWSEWFSLLMEYGFSLSGSKLFWSCNLLWVKWNSFFVSRAKANKSQSEGSGDSDSLGSLQDSTGGSSTQLPGQGSLDDGESTQPVLDYDTVLVISLNTFSPPECPGLMAEEKVLSTVQVSWVCITLLE